MSNLQEIKDLVSISAVADYLGLVEEYGKCKFPGERTASIQLYKDNRFRDFGILWLKMISSTVYPRAWHFRSLPEKGLIRITNAMQMFMDINEKHWHYSDLHYRHAEDIHFSNRMEN